MRCYSLLVILISIALSQAYRSKYPRHREYFKSMADYDVDDYSDYDYPLFAKESDADKNRPSIFSYWNRLLKRTRLSNWNITNPFTKLFTPYVVKVDFPPETDSGADAQPIRNGNKKKKVTQPEYLQYANTYGNNIETESGQYFYDPVTQQYYEVQQTDSEFYNPQNNYYATTFNDDDEIVINLGNSGKGENRESEEPEYDENASEDEVNIQLGKSKGGGLISRYNSPAIREFKVKSLSSGRKSSTDHRHPIRLTTNLEKLLII